MEWIAYLLDCVHGGGVVSTIEASRFPGSVGEDVNSNFRTVQFGKVESGCLLDAHGNGNAISSC